MIVTKSDHSFIMFEQNEHAKVSGLIASYWLDSLFQGKQMRKEVEWAISHHDRAWILLDEQPIWNEEKDSPYSFMDYPLEEKIEAYEQGVDDIKEESYYAALLCSMHFTAFFDKNSTNKTISRYISREIERQKQLRKMFMNSVSDEELHFHFELLKFCDSLSLYICLNEPGVPKSDENKMFVNGFPQNFEGLHGQIHATWIGEDFVSVHPFPFKQNFSVKIPYKRVKVDDIKKLGLTKSYEKEKFHNRQLTIGKKELNSPSN